MKGNVVYVAVASLCGTVIGYQPFRPVHYAVAFLYFFFLFRRKRRLVWPCACACAAFLLYMLAVERHNETVLSPQTSHFSVRIITPPIIDGDRLKAVVETVHEQEKLQLLYRIKSEREQRALSRVQIGMVCAFEGALQEPDPARNPAGFDYRTYLRHQSIHWLVKPAALSLRQCRPTSLSFYERLLFIRQKGLEEIESAFPPVTVGIVQALIYGERTEMDEQLLDSYQKLGLVHLLAISGSHVTLLVGACFYVLIRFVTRETAALVLLAALPVYMVMTGVSPSVVRASLTAMLVLGIRYKKSTIPPLDALSAVFLLMIAAQPYALFQAGFQLSFIVSLALILSINMIEQYESPIARLALTTFVAQTAALPFLLYHFFEFSLLSLPLNLVFVPLYSLVILPLSLASLMAHYASEPLGALLMRLLEHILVWSNELVLRFGQSSSFSFVLGRPSSWLLAAYGSAIIFAFTQLEKKRYRSLVWIAAVMFAHALAPYLNRYGEVVFVDVGQGDCIYIELPHRKGVYLIDTGGEAALVKQAWQKRQREWSVGKQIVLPFLKAKGVRKLDRLLITHGDTDHMGAALEIMQHIRVKELWIGKGGSHHPLQASLVAAANERGTAFKEVQRGDGWRIGDARFVVLHPANEQDALADNNRSIVLHARLGPLSWLFTGDLEQEGERELTQTFPHLRADVLKVGHHGSATSTSELLLEAVQPTYAIISVGEYNRYGHPHPDVIKRLQKRGIRIWRTDQHGAIRYAYTKKSGTFTATLP